MGSTASVVSAALAFGIAATIVVTRDRWTKGSRYAPLPPGPPKTPWIGNLGDMPTLGREWETYTQWAQKYGEIVYVEVLGHPIVILNSFKAATELFDRRGSNYSDRPSTTMLRDVLGWDWIIGFMPYGEWWRRHRKVFHTYFNPKAVVAQYPVQRKAAHGFMKSLLESPAKFEDHATRFSGTIILESVYGYEVRAEKDPYVELVHKADEAFNKVAGSTFLVDIIPFLRHLPLWLPGTKSLRDAQKWKKLALDMRSVPFKLLQDSMKNGTAPSSLVSEEINKIQSRSEGPADDLDVVRNCAGAAYGAAADTTTSTILTLILAMVLQPEVQKRAQAEVDAVVKARGRLPDFDDMSAMPYVECCITEALRWRPVIPCAIPHRNINGDEYEGYHIPAGSVVIGNIWAILHDGTDYPEPEAFKPERFWSRDGHTPARDPLATVFGFGRRVCPGKHLAMNSVFLAFASILATFTLSRAKDESGNDIIPSTVYTYGSTIHPQSFECVFTPRPEAVEMLQRAGDF